jgi:hypothetical protein
MTGLVEQGRAWARANPLLAAAIVAGLIARVVFWAVTDRQFEDALITIKHAKNAAAGVGLVHHLGEGHVQGFTSALSVLVPLPGELIAAGGGMVAIRLASLVCFVLAAVYANRIALKLSLGTWPTALVLAYLAFDQLQIFYGMSGMETQIAVAVLLAGIYYVWEERYMASGLALGLALLARPDFVLWIFPAFVFLGFRSRRGTVRAGLVAAATVAPWLVFTTAYYGSPIPETIKAKAQAFPPFHPSFLDPGAWFHYAGDQLSYNSHDWSLLSPFLERTGTVHTPLPYGLLEAVGILVAVLAVVGIVVTWRHTAWRAAIVFVLLFLAYKYFFLPNFYYEWYYPPALAVIVILAAAGLERATVPLPALGAAVAGCLALLYAVHMPFSIPLEARIQHDIEDRVRAPLGEYLARVVRPGQTMASESSGYVGYDTNATLYDFPGLTSPTVYHTLGEAGHDYYSVCGVVSLLKPDWAVLRPLELDVCRAKYPGTMRDYRRVRTFSVSDAQSSLTLGGLTFGNADRQFIVLRRRP